MLIRLFSAHSMTKYLCTTFLGNYKQLLTKKLVVYCCTLYINELPFCVMFTATANS